MQPVDLLFKFLLLIISFCSKLSLIIYSTYLYLTLLTLSCPQNIPEYHRMEELPNRYHIIYSFV